MRNAILVSSVVLFMACTMARADSPTTAPSDQGFSLTSPRVGQLAACTYLYTTLQTTYAQMNTVATPTVHDVETAMRNGGIAAMGAPIFIYKNAGADPNAPFTLEIGFPVAGGTEAVGNLQVANLDATRSALAVYFGPLSNIGKAYEQLFGDVVALGEMPASERRERYVYWEGPDSPNNIILIEIALRNTPGGQAPGGL